VTTPHPPVRIGMSACLAGERVRWDATDRLQRRLIDVIGAMAELVTVCPEVELGLGVPRERVRLVDGPGGVRLIGEDSGRDLTDDMTVWAGARLDRPDVAGVDGWIFKSGSPSCGVAGVRLYEDASRREFRRAGRGLFAAIVRARWPDLPVAEEEQLADDDALGRFAAATLAYHNRAKHQPGR
jgi:uncharacterized protein YbbK (DUF523 family)